MVPVYIPKIYQMSHEEAIQLMKSNPFAILVTVENQLPIATHIPVEICEKSGKIYVTGHIAYGNKQKKTLGNYQDVLLIFQGPHAYISSSWYECEEVPTWNYLAVHAYGKSRILSQEELKESLASLLHRYEAHRKNGRLWETFQIEWLEKEMKGIVGFEVEIHSIQAAVKMSQNRNDTDYKSIVTELEKSDEPVDKQVARWMREKRKDLFK